MTSDMGRNLYEAGAAYWKSVAPSVEGMLGGFPQLSTADVSDSKAFLKQLFSKQGVPKRRSLDCGSGIGRVTKQVLLPFFHTVDMVDVTREFIDASAEYLGPKLNERVGQKFCSGLQDFSPETKVYDVIWIQWVSGHLTDGDLVDFLRRCKSGLTEKGAIVVKENVASAEGRDFDEEDSSYTRPRRVFLDLFVEAGLEIIREKKQLNFPKGMYEVRMFALRDAP